MATGNGFSYVYQPTLGIELVSKKVIIKDVLYKICIWDTAGQE
jgi:GTPase SAR1 family protein